MGANGYFYQHSEASIEETEDAVAVVNGKSPATETTDRIVPSFQATTNEASLFAQQQTAITKMSQEKQLKVQQAGFDEKVEGIKGVASDTMAAGVIDYFKYDNAFLRDEDESFRNSFGDDDVELILNQYGLDDNSYSIVKDAVSLEHANDLATLEKMKKESLAKVQSSLTSSENFWYTLAAEVVTDPTTWVVPMAYAGAKALSKADKLSTLANKQIAGWSAGADVGYGATVGAIDDDMSMAEALSIYGTIGFIDYKLVRGLKTNDGLANNLASKDAKTSSQAETSSKQDELRAQIDEGLKVERVKVERNEVMGRKIDLEDELENLAKGSDEHIAMSKKIDNLEKQIKSYDDIGVKPKAPKTLTPQAQAYTKSLIESRMKLAMNTGFKNLQKIVKSPSKSALSSDALRLINETITDVEAIGAKIEMEIADVKKSVEALGKGGDRALVEDIVEVYRALHKEGHISKSSMGQIEASFKKGAGEGFAHPKIEITPTKNGKGAKIKINGKVAKVVGASALATTVVSAADSGDVAVGVGAMIVAGILGVKAINAMKSANGSTLYQKASSIVSDMRNSDNTRSIRARIGDTMMKTRTTLTETVEPMYRNIQNKEMRKIVGDLYYNPLDAIGSTIETIKRQIKDTHFLGMNKEIQPIYKEWLKDGKVTKVDELGGIFNSMSFRVKFNKELFEFMELGKHQDNVHLASAANITQRYYKSIFDKTIDAGVKGADKMVKTTGKYHVPRVVDSIGFSNKMANITDESFELVVKSFSNMLTKTKDAEEVARVYINAIINTSDAGKTFTKDARQSLIKELKAKGLADDMIEDIISTTSGQYGRTKARIDMDYSKFGNVEVKYGDGTTASIGYDDIFNSDIMSASSSLFNSASGHIAMAHKGYSSVDDLLGVVNSSKIDPSYKNTLSKDIMATVGVSSIDYSQTANIVAKNIANAAIGRGMLLSTISLMSEGAVALANMVRSSGVMGMAKTVTGKARNTLGDDSFALHSIVSQEDGFGYGMHQYGATYGQFRTFDEFGNIESSIEGVGKVTEIWRDFTLHTLPFVRSSDLLERLNLQDTLDTLKGHFDGKITFKDYEIKAFGISKHMENKLKGALTLNEKGHVAFFDYTKWNLKDQIEFKSVVDRIMMKRMNKATMGTASAFSRHSAIGVALMPMLKFPMTAYSNIGSFMGRGMLQGDTFAMTQAMMWFQAGMVQSMIRNEINGREQDDVSLMYAGFMNMPMSGVYGTAMGLLHSPTTKTMGEVSEVIDLYNYTK